MERVNELSVIVAKDDFKKLKEYEEIALKCKFIEQISELHGVSVNISEFSGKVFRLKNEISKLENTFIGNKEKLHELVDALKQKLDGCDSIIIKEVWSSRFRDNFRSDMYSNSNKDMTEFTWASVLYTLLDSNFDVEHIHRIEKPKKSKEHIIKVDTSKSDVNYKAWFIFSAVVAVISIACHIF